MLPTINTCENGWSNFSPNLRVVTIKLIELTQFASPNLRIFFHFLLVWGPLWCDIFILTARANPVVEKYMIKHNECWVIRNECWMTHNECRIKHNARWLKHTECWWNLINVDWNIMNVEWNIMGRVLFFGVEPWMQHSMLIIYLHRWLPHPKYID